jgi:uncharacterized protein YcbK (DUF882 family)
MSWTRRQLLKVGALAGVSAAGFMTRSVRAGDAGAGQVSVTAKRLSLLNLHTSEKLELEFCRRGEYVPESLTAIQSLLRDYRNGEQHVIDPRLMDYLFDVAAASGVDPVFSVISGYRSPQTNEQLRERSNGVARHSLHLEGRAIDVRLAGVNCAVLADHARAMSRGGVGYYQKSDFVHLDTGMYRSWNG